MKILSLLQKIHSGENHTEDLTRHYIRLNNTDRHLYSARYFADFLILERKRSERSRRPFVLMIIGIKEFSKAYEQREITQDITRVLFATTRDTDIKGWYRHNKAIGIILNEISSETQNFKAVQKLTINKVKHNLKEYLGMARFNKLELSYQVFPEDFTALSKTEPSDDSEHPYFTPQPPAKRIKLAIKRLIDIIGSLCAIVLFIPVFLLVAVFIKLTSPGDVFFKQERVGLYGKWFMFLKFRSMYNNNDPTIHKEFVRNLIQGSKDCNDKCEGNNRGQEYKIKNDPRVTPIGSFLRKTSLDELPQFFNVLKGDMSLVGPRPPIPYECEDYDVWHRSRVLDMKPGITGLWQVDGRSTTSFDDMVRMDIKYIRNWSLWLDIKILVKTPFVVLACKGAY